MKAADIAVAVPVRNEAERLPGLLAALAAQQQARPFTLCLFFDQCSDGSEAAVAALTPSLRYRIVTDCCDTGAPPNAGRARRRACELAVATVGNGVLLTTDADSTPAPDWIAANLAALDHSDIVAGRIVRDAAAPSPRQDQLEAYYDRLHALRRTLDPVAWEAPLTHHWTSAASLAMTALTYRALGGFATVATGEDAALADAAARLGFRLRRDAAAPEAGQRHMRGEAALLGRHRASGHFPGEGLGMAGEPAGLGVGVAHFQPQGHPERHAQAAHDDGHPHGPAHAPPPSLAVCRLGSLPGHVVTVLPFKGCLSSIVLIMNGYYERFHGAIAALQQ